MLTSKRWELTFLPFFIQVILGFGSPVAWHTNDATPPETPVWSSGDLTKVGEPDRVAAKWAEGDVGRFEGREGGWGEVKVMLAQWYQHEKLSYLWFSLSLHKGNKRSHKRSLSARTPAAQSRRKHPAFVCGPFLSHGEFLTSVWKRRFKSRSEAGMPAISKNV